MNVAYGGTLVGHLPDVPGLQVHGVPLDESQTIHDVTPEPGSRLAAVTDAGTLACLSHHHQGSIVSARVSRSPAGRRTD